MEEAQIIDDTDIPWSAIRGLGLRVVKYAAFAAQGEGMDLLGRTIVKHAFRPLPYAVLEVECIDRKPAAWKSKRAIFPIYHRDDFRAVDEAMALASDELEVVVGYRPIKFPWYWPMKRAMPKMVVWVRTKDQERRDGESAQEYLHRTHPVWTYEPLVSRFQGRWLYEE